MKKFLLASILIIGFVLFCGLCTQFPETVKALIFPTRFEQGEVGNTVDQDGIYFYTLEVAQLPCSCICFEEHSVHSHLNIWDGTELQEYNMVGMSGQKVRTENTGILIYNRLPIEVETILQMPKPAINDVYNYIDTGAHSVNLIQRC